MELPFGVSRMLALLPEPGDVLDVGCGSGRLTAALAERGWAATGIDTSDSSLAVAEGRSPAVTWRWADMNDPLPFADGSFDAVVSRLSLMIARDPAATLAEERRLLRPGGRIVTAVWAEVPANAWFGHPRTAVANALGPDRARFARRFGQLGTADELASVHRAGGFTGVEVEVVADALEFASPAAHWRSMVSTIGHFERLDDTLTHDEREAVIAELARITAAQPELSRTQLIAHAPKGE